MQPKKIGVEAISHALSSFDWQTRIQALLDLAHKNSLVVKFASSFGVEDQLLTHQIAASSKDPALELELFTLDTGRLFPSTYQVWQETEQKYPLRVHAYYPDAEALENFVKQSGINGFYHSIAARKDCCSIRKIEPLLRALANADIWISGLRRSQDSERSEMPLVEFDQRFNLIKVNPLFDLELEQIWDFVKENKIPYNALHDQGFPSIGCAPCTRAVQPGEPIRAGRWWWEADLPKECGLHSRKISSLAARATKESA